MTSEIKGFKYLRPGSEVAIRIQGRFGRGTYHVLRVISEVDFIAGVVRLAGTAYEFGLDGVELGYTGGEPRQRMIVPVPDGVRREVWRRQARGRIEALLHNWQKVDDSLIQAIIATIDRGSEGGDAADRISKVIGNDPSEGVKNRHELPD